jgi:hypothetical protein
MEQELQQFQEQFVRYREQVEQDRTRLNEEFTRYREQAEQELHRLAEEFTPYQERIARDVFEAVLGRLVNEGLVDEIKQLLQVPFMKTKCHYTIRFMKPYDEMSTGWCVLRRDMSFVVTNIGQETRDFTVRSSYTSDEDFASAGWGERPVHLGLSVNGEDIPVERFLTDERGYELAYSVRLEAHQSARIFLRGEEPMRVEASRSYYQQGTPADALDVLIENNYSEAIGPIEVQMHHPGRSQMEYDRHREHYSLRRAFIPGQGFEVIWKRVQTQAPSVMNTVRDARESAA